MFKSKPLTVENVFLTLLKIAKSEGKQSQTHKIRHIQRLYIATRESEAKYITRHLQGKQLRMGVDEQTVICALARAWTLTPSIHYLNRMTSIFKNTNDMVILENRYIFQT